MTKSYVTVEQQVCLVCGKPFDTGSILLDKRMRDKFENTTVTGWGACPEHQKLADGGYVALVEAQEHGGEHIPPEDADRTGRIAHLRKEQFEELFTAELNPEQFPMVFVDSDVITQLIKLQEQ